MVFNFFRTRKNAAMEEAQPIQAATAATEAAAIPPAQTLDQAGAETEVRPAVATVSDAASASASIAVAEPEKLHGIDQPMIEGQLHTMEATREDVIAAYKIFLGRQPESMEVVDPRVGVKPMALLVDFLTSKEFLDQPTKAQLVLAVAKRILDARKAQDTAQPAEAQPIKSP